MITYNYQGSLMRWRVNQQVRLGHVLKQDVVNAHAPHCYSAALCECRLHNQCSPLPYYDFFMALRSTVETLYYGPPN